MKNDLHNWESYNEMWSNRIEVPSNLRIINAMENFKIVKDKKIIEIGSAMGRDSIYLAKLGAEVHLLDFSSNALLQAERLAKKENVTITTMCCDALNISYNNDTFDVVYSQGLYEHFINIDALLNEQIRILKSNGYLYIDVPQTFNIYTLFKKILMLLNKWEPGWERQFTPIQLLNETKHEKLEFIGFYGDWSNPPFIYKILLSLFKMDYTKYRKNKVINWENKLRKFFLTKYTYQHIGIVLKKS